MDRSAARGAAGDLLPAASSAEDPGLQALIDKIVAWVEAAALRADSGVDVAGADKRERRCLAALGGLAQCLVGPAIDEWPDALRSWAVGGSAPPAALVDQVRSALDSRPDPLAAIYERIVSGRSRRSLGTFFTPPVVVDWMLEGARRLLPRPVTVIDPGAGVGAFALAAAARWSEATVVAVDVNAVTLGLLAARATRLSGRLRLVHEDFLDWSQSGAAELAGPRLWIGNPPYTRHQSMPEAARESARRLGSSLVRSGLAGLSAYFLAAILQSLRPEDALCLLLPGSWTDARYGAPLRARLAALRRREVGLVAFPSERQLFPGTRVTGMVLLVGPESATEQAMWSAKADTVQEGVTVSSQTPHDRELAPALGFGGWLWSRRESHLDDAVALSTIARVRRGVATGSNRLFLLTDTEAGAMPQRYIRRAVRSLREIESDRLDQTQYDMLGRLGHRRWLLEIPPGTDLEADPALAHWRARAMPTLQASYIGSHRHAWYSVEHVEPPDILLSPMGKGRMKAVWNLVGAVPSNAIYGIYLRDLKATSPDRLCVWLNSPEGQAALLRRARAYGAGLFNLEPRDARDVGVPSAIAGITLPSLGLVREDEDAASGR